MSNGITATVVGWIATPPRQVIGPSGVAFASFRMASTPRYFDRTAGSWADGRTEWITVKVFRDSAFNVAASLHKGDPVLVTGRLATSEWESENGPRTDLVLEATALGPDVTRGTCVFARTVHTGPGGQSGGPEVSVEADDGAPGAGAERSGSGAVRGEPDRIDDLEDLGPEDPFADLAASAVAVATP
jgi:single-strand DNA-binding protein